MMNSNEMSLRKLFLKSCEKNDLEKVRECLNQGVDVNTVSEDRQVFQRSPGLAIAAENNYPELLNLLLSQPGINVNLAWGWTPLMYACAAGHHEIVRRLLQVPGINILHEDSDGDTALHEAALQGHSECLEELAKVPGLDWNCRGGYCGSTPHSTVRGTLLWPR